MNWRVDVVLSVLFGAGCGAAALGVWRWDRRRLVGRYEKRRLAAEAESDRLRLRISALRAAETRAAESAEELARLRPVAARVPVLEDELAGARARADRLDRTEEQLTQARLELEQLTGRLDTHVHRRRRAARELQTVSAMAAKAEQDAAEARSMVAAAKALVARRDETILALEQRLARLDEFRAAGGSAPGGKGEKVARRKGDRTSAKKGKKDKAGKKGAEKKARKPAPGGPTPSPIRPGPDHDDDLKAIPGIGPVVERALHRVGIRSWEQVAALSAADLARVAAATDSAPAQLERDDWVGGARRLLARHRPPAGPVGDTGHRDDLQAIIGIGPVLERVLNSHGIVSWEQLAGLDDAEVARLSVELPGVPGRIEREGWVAQAAALVERFPLGPDGRPRRGGPAPHHPDPA